MVFLETQYAEEYICSKQLRFHHENVQIGTCTLNSVISYWYKELEGTQFNMQKNICPKLKFPHAQLFRMESVGISFS